MRRAALPGPGILLILDLDHLRSGDLDLVPDLL